MKKIMSVCLVSLSLLLSACSNVGDEAIYPAVDTQQLDQILSKQDAINGFKSVVNEHDILVALNIKRMKRFKKEQVEKSIAKQIEEKFPDKAVLVTGDLKIKWEIEKVMDKQLKTAELSKEIEKIKSLSKEET